MTLSKRLWFVVATLIYVIMLGILTGNCVDQACQLWDLNPVIVNLRYESTTFQAAAVFGGLIAIVLQCYRLAASCLRSSDPQRQTTTELFFGLQWNLQYRCLIFLLLFWGITRIRYALH